MTIIEFRIPAVPKGQPRQAQRVVVPKGGKPFAMNYMPKGAPIHNFKATVRMAAEKSYVGPPLTGPLRVDMTFVFPRSKAQTWKTRPMPRIPHDKKPDRDNCDKAVLDALKGLMFIDDCQACDGRIQKWIAAGDEQPHVMVRVETIE